MRGSSIYRFRRLIFAFAISLLLHLVVFFMWWPASGVLHPAKSAKAQILRVTLHPLIFSDSKSIDSNQPDIDTDIDTGASPKPSALEYHRSDELTKPAQLVDEIAQDVELPVGIDVSKHLILRVIVGTTGNALAVSVLESTLPREVEAEIVKRFYVARYQPGEINKQTVVSEMLVSIDLQ
jgi:hypothetical protein